MVQAIAVIVLVGHPMPMVIGTCFLVNVSVNVSNKWYNLMQIAYTYLPIPPPTSPGTALMS